MKPNESMNLWRGETLHLRWGSG